MSTDMSNTTTACEEFLDDLAAVLDGDEAILARHLDHLSGCDDCRDARHEAQGAVSALRGAGADFAMPAGLEDRLLAGLPAADEVAPVTRSAPDAVPIAPAPLARPAGASRRMSIPRGWLAGGALAVAATAVAIVVVSGDDGSAPADAPAAQAGAWAGSLAAIDRAADDGASGVELAAGGAFAPAAAGGPIGPGSVLRTDERTRAEIRLGDGTTVHLDHATEIRLGSSGRQLVLVKGNLVADVAHLDNGANARFETPSGAVEVLGTRFALAATDKHTSVRVVRGLVRLSAGDRVVDVQAGEEGTVDAGGAPEVAAGGDLVGAIGWSELLSQDEPADEVPAGIGELRAYKPGEKRDRDWRLSLASHKVTVRIVGNVRAPRSRRPSRTTAPCDWRASTSSRCRPTRASSGLALDVDGKMEEGAFVARERASKIWRGVIQKATPRPQIATDDIVWVPGPWRDPALLEWQRGGRFELRIFPIPPAGRAPSSWPTPRSCRRRPPGVATSTRCRIAPTRRRRQAVRPRHPAGRRRPGGRAAGAELPARREPRRRRLPLHPQGRRLPAARRPGHRVQPAGPRRRASRLELRRRGRRRPDHGGQQARRRRSGSRRGPEAGRRRSARHRPHRAPPRPAPLDRGAPARLRHHARLEPVDGGRALHPRPPAGRRAGRRDGSAATASRSVACDLDCQRFADKAEAPSAAAARRLSTWLDEIQPAGASDLVAGSITPPTCSTAIAPATAMSGSSTSATACPRSATAAWPTCAPSRPPSPAGPRVSINTDRYRRRRRRQRPRRPRPRRRRPLHAVRPRPARRARRPLHPRDHLRRLAS
jgi:ferric-dicitrate binding protein FerR (iron transport regulator)